MFHIPFKLQFKPKVLSPLPSFHAPLFLSTQYLPLTFPLTKLARNFESSVSLKVTPPSKEGKPLKVDEDFLTYFREQG